MAAFSLPGEEYGLLESWRCLYTDISDMRTPNVGDDGREPNLFVTAVTNGRLAIQGTGAPFIHRPNLLSYYSYCVYSQSSSYPSMFGVSVIPCSDIESAHFRGLPAALGQNKGGFIFRAETLRILVTLGTKRDCFFCQKDNSSNFPIAHQC